MLPARFSNVPLDIHVGEKPVQDDLNLDFNSILLKT